MSDTPKDIEADDKYDEDDLPVGLDAEETARYLLSMAFPDDDSQAIEEGVEVLTYTTFGELRQGRPLSMPVVYDAAVKLERIFPIVR
ncbi:hypothetical protein [Streptomyces mirabilis]